MTHAHTSRRAAFSLIELMGVIVIIGILIAILLPALSSAFKFGTQTAARSEIAQLDVAISAAKQDLGYGGIPLPYLPSALVLCDTWSHYTTPPAGTATHIKALLAPSQQFLQRMFGKNIGSGTNPVNGANLDWNGNGVSDPPVLLLGDQVLWFFLGGVPSTSSGLNNYIGFASNPVDPTLQPGATGAGNRKGPYFDFVPSRLVQRTAGFMEWNGTVTTTTTTPTPANSYFPLYQDFYKHEPYIYLSSYGGQGYNNWITTFCTIPTVPSTLVGRQLNNDINQFQFYGLLSQYLNTNGATAVGGGVTNVTAPTVYPPTITTALAHGLSVGQQVNIAGVGGATFVNGTWLVASVGPGPMPPFTTFTIAADNQNIPSNLPPTPPPGTYTGGGTVTLVISTTPPVPFNCTINPNTYQLVTAGSDGAFGAGGLWNPATGYPVSSPPSFGADDLANFSKLTLGKPAN
jgi:type II secretory pathway pseudopilin PulG